MAVVPIRKSASKPETKIVEANQKSIDALALNSGTWKVQGIPGLYVRARATSKSFMLQRRIDRDLVRLMLGSLTMKAAKEQAMKRWGILERKPADGAALTLGAAIEQYVEAKTAAGKIGRTSKPGIARCNTEAVSLDRCGPALAEGVGKDRLGVRQLQQRITSGHGRATSNQCVRLLAAVYRWARDADETLPEWPRKAAEIHTIKARDWAYTPDELRAWWSATRREKDDKVTAIGVKTLGPIKRMWWLAALFTGARKGSIEALKWADVDLEKKVIRFRVTKGDRPYSVPMSDTLAALFTRYWESSEVPPSDWVFPSPVIVARYDHVDIKNPREASARRIALRHTFQDHAGRAGRIAGSGADAHGSQHGRRRLARVYLDAAGD